MNDLDRELAATFEAMAAAGDLGHADAEELAAYHDGELAAQQARRLQGHLAGCRECTALLLEIDRLAEPVAEETWERDDEEAWQALRPLLARARETPRAQPFRSRLMAGLEALGEGLRGYVPRGTPRLAYALAASLLAGVVGLSAWVVELRQTVGELSRPQINVPVRDLYPTDYRRGEGEALEVVEIPVRAGYVALVLNPLDAPSWPDYRVEILDPGGRVVWSAGGLERSPWNTFTLGLPGGALAPGEYRLRLEGVDGERHERIEEFPLRILGE